MKIIEERIQTVKKTQIFGNNFLDLFLKEYLNENES